MRKKINLLIGVVTVISFGILFVACNKTATIQDISGVWVANSYSAKDGKEVEMNQDLANNQYISIEKDGTGILANYGNKFNGKITDNGDNTFTFKDDSGSLEDLTYLYENERLSLDRTDEYNYPYIEYYAKTTMNALKASLKESETIQCQLISLDIPSSWRGKYDFDYKINEDKSGYVTLYNKASKLADVGGDLVTIMIIEPSTDYDVYPDYKYLGKLKQNGFDYSVVALYPTDVRFNSDTQGEYEEMQKDLDNILSSIKGINGTEFVN